MKSFSRSQVIVGVFVLFIMITGIFAWYKKSSSRNNLDYASIPAKCDDEVDNITSLPAGEIEKEYQEINDEKDKIKKIFNSGSFKELDNYAHGLRMEKIRYSYGGWKLDTFYEMLSYPTIEKPQKATEEQWKMHLDKLTKWVNQNPGSITARISAALALLEYADVKRDRFWVKNNHRLTEEEMQSFKDTTLEVEQILEEAGKIPEKSFDWYSAMLGIAYARHWDSDRYNKLFDEAINMEPLYEQFYNQKLYYLEEYGYQKGDIEKFANEMYNKFNGNKGRRIYFMIISHFIGSKRMNMNVFNKTELSWDKAIEGYNASNELFGESAMRLNFFCYLATAAQDVKTVRKTMKRIGPNINLKLWADAKYYGEVKDWAFKQCKN